MDLIPSFNGQKFVKKLNDAMRDLETKRKITVLECEVAVFRDKKQRSEKVERWLEEVNRIQEEVKAIQSDLEQSRRSGIFGIPNYSLINRIGKRAAELLVKVIDLERTDIMISKPPAPAVEEIDISMLSSYLNKVRGYLEEDGGEIIGIWGMGGVGKTTLLQAITNTFLHCTYAASGAEVLFDLVIFVVVSNDCVFGELQKCIANRLCLPSSNDLCTQAAIIFDFLKGKNFLLLLDDVWEAVDLRAIGIPDPYNTGNSSTGRRWRHKVVLTTRSEEVCAYMDSHKIMKMDCLRQEEAWELFKLKVGGDILDSCPDIRRCALEVVKECCGLPLALVTIGQAMSNKQSVAEWENAILQLKKPQFSTTRGMEDSIFQILKLIYDRLPDEKSKYCFICCSLWPELFSIEKDKLIMSWMGLGLIDAFDDINQADDEGYSLIGRLKEACLLETLQNDDGDDYLVKIHDIVRDLELWIASDHGEGRNRWVVIAGAGLEQVSTDMAGQWKNAERISLMCNKIAELNSTLVTSYCPNLLSLSLQYNRLTEMPAALHQCMPNLTFLDLSANYKLRKIPNEIGCLIRLRYLNLSYTKISSLPEELWQLSNLKYLLLRHTRKLVSIPGTMLPSLSKLEVLDMYPHGICSCDELACLPRGLKALGVKITSAENLQQLSDHHVPIIDLNMHDMGDLTSIHLRLLGRITQGCLQELKICECDNVRELVMDVNSLPRLKTLVLDGLENMREIIWNNAVPSECFWSLQVLNIYKCHGLKNISWVLHLPGLDYLSVKECDGIEQLIDNCEIELVEPTSITFPRLKSLQLYHLPKLSGICSDYPALIFPCLERVEVFSCPELKKLPSRPQCRRLSSIKCQRTWWEAIQWEDESIMSFHSPLAEVCNIEFDTLDDLDDSSEFDSSQDSDNSIDGSKFEIPSSNVNIQVVQGKTDINRITEPELKKSQLGGLKPNVYNKYNEESRGSHRTTSKDKETKCSDRSQISFRDEWSSLQVLYSDIKDATNGFSESLKIGKGGYGSVYKGKLGGTVVAIKMLDSTSKQGEKEFFQELEVLHEMRHPNLVKLVGACFEDHVLVYEYLPHGSLEDCLKDNPILLTWQMRTRIIYEICSALIYLHSRFVVHGDLKPANILLNANFKSKLSDFGLCRFLPKDMSSDVFLETVPKGTEGYIDPVFFETSILRPGSDLYSFGITILKLLTGLPPLGLGRKARDADENLFLEMIDCTAGSWPSELAKELLYWSLKCCYHNEKSLELLKDISTCLEDMLAEIEASQEGRFKAVTRRKRADEDSLMAEEKKKEEMKEEWKVEVNKEHVVLKVHMHCEDCAQEIKKRILRMKGVEAVEPEMKASQVTVKGVFDPLELVEYVHHTTGGMHITIVKVEPVGKKPEEEKRKEQEKNGDNAKEVNEELSLDKAKIEQQRKEFYYHPDGAADK